MLGPRGGVVLGQQRDFDAVRHQLPPLDALLVAHAEAVPRRHVEQARARRRAHAQAAPRGRPQEARDRGAARLAAVALHAPRVAGVARVARVAVVALRVARVGPVAQVDQPVHLVHDAVVAAARPRRHHVVLLVRAVGHHDERERAPLRLAPGGGLGVAVAQHVHRAPRKPQGAHGVVHQRAGGRDPQHAAVAGGAVRGDAARHGLAHSARRVQQQDVARAFRGKVEQALLPVAQRVEGVVSVRSLRCLALPPLLRGVQAFPVLREKRAQGRHQVAVQVALLHAVDEAAVDALRRGGARPQRGAHRVGAGVGPGAVGQVALQRARAANHLQKDVAPHAAGRAALGLDGLQDAALARGDGVHAVDVAPVQVVVRPAAREHLAEDVAHVPPHGGPGLVGRRILKRQPVLALVAPVDDAQRGARVRDGRVLLDLADAGQQPRPRVVHDRGGSPPPPERRAGALATRRAGAHKKKSRIEPLELARACHGEQPRGHDRCHHRPVRQFRGAGGTARPSVGDTA